MHAFSRVVDLGGPGHHLCRQIVGSWQVEVDLLRCIGCQLCARYCPWETIDMWSYEEGLQIAPSRTVRSLIYAFEPEQMNEAAECRADA